MVNEIKNKNSAWFFEKVLVFFAVFIFAFLISHPAKADTQISSSDHVWQMDGGASTVFKDDIGTANLNASCVNATTTGKFGDGYLGTCYGSFMDYLNTTSSAIGSDGSFWLHYWIKMTTDGSAWGMGDGTNGLEFYADTPELFGILSGSQTGYPITGTGCNAVINDGLWHMYDFVYNGTAHTMNPYIDGNACNQISMTVVLTGAPDPFLGFGRNIHGTDALNGEIDNIGFSSSTGLNSTQVTSLWNGGTGSRLIGGSGPPPAATIGFTFPQNGTSTGLFNPWLLNANNLNASDTYFARVQWVACPLNAPNTDPNCTVPIFNRSVSQTASDILMNGITVPRTEWNFDFASNQTIYAQANLYDAGIPVAATADTFTLLTIPNSSPSSTLGQGGIYTIATSTGNGTYSITTSTGFAVINTQGTSTITAFCTPPGDASGYIGYGLCQAINFAFNPNIFPQSGNYFSDKIQTLSMAPPFTGVITTFSSLQNAVSSSPAGQDFNVTVNLGSTSGTIPFLTSSTMSQAITSSGKTVLFNLEDAVFSLLDLGLIFFVPWHWWRKKQQAPIQK